MKFVFQTVFLFFIFFASLQVIAVNINETIYVDESLKIRGYYAGHVLGAAMFQVMVGSESILYTGNNNFWNWNAHMSVLWAELLLTKEEMAATKSKFFTLQVLEC